MILDKIKNTKVKGLALFLFFVVASNTAISQCPTSYTCESVGMTSSDPCNKLKLSISIIKSKTPVVNASFSGVPAGYTIQYPILLFDATRVTDFPDGIASLGANKEQKMNPRAWPASAFNNVYGLVKLKDSAGNQKTCASVKFQPQCTSSTPSTPTTINFCDSGS